MDAEHPNKRPSFDKKGPDRNVRRRELYKLNMAIEKNALSLQQQLSDQVLESRLKITIPTTSTELTTTSPCLLCTLNTENYCSAPKTVAKLTAIPSFPASAKGNPSAIYEKGSTSGACNENYNTATTATTQRSHLARRNRGIYTFRVQGRMYHRIDDLYPSGRKPKNLQLYFYDNDNELANRMACFDRVNECVVRELMDILRINPYSFFVRSLLDVPQLQNFHIALKRDPGLDQRVYNLPTSSEITAIWVEENDRSVSHAPHIQIYTHSNRTQIVNYYYGCYDALQYPLLFPYGQNGWHCGIKKICKPKNLRGTYATECEQLPSIRNHCSVNSYLEMEAQALEKGKHKRDTVSVREYYCYKIQMRDDDEDEMLHTGRLFQQYSVDEYIKLESQRLDFKSFNQDLFRMDVLQGLLDILRLGERDASNVGKKNIPFKFFHRWT